MSVILLSAFIIISLLCILSEACKDQIWYQAIEDVTVDYYNSDLVSSVDECARKCYQSFPFCKSAVYEPVKVMNKRYCKYSFWQFNCKPEHPLITGYQSNDKNLLLHCIHCWKSVGPGETGKKSSDISQFRRRPVGENHALNVNFDENTKTASFRVMTFNTWNSGSNVFDGLNKIARHISLLQPDVVALQEMYEDKIFRLLQLMDYKYNVCMLKSDSNYIITKLPIVENHMPSSFLTNTGCRIRIFDSLQGTVNLWNVHLDYKNYGPYTACQASREFFDANILFNGEYRPHDPLASRLDNILNLINNEPFRRQIRDVDQTPLILMGDLNSPSHLDWTENFKPLHCNWSFVWPVTHFIENIGFRDSFRILNPNIEKFSGNTWSPIYKLADYDIVEPQDRIDFIFWAGKSLKPTKSFVYNGTEKLAQHPLHYFNDWPSDHNAVIADFELTVTDT